MRKILLCLLATLATSSQSHGKEPSVTALQDSDYVNFAQDQWGAREGGWNANSALKALIHEVEKESAKCSDAMKYVPLPYGAPPTTTAFAKYVLTLRNNQKKIEEGLKYKSCIKEAALMRKTPAELTQIE